MADEVKDQEKLYDPVLAPYVDTEADELTQIGPDGKRHPISELAADEGSDSTVPEGGTPPAAPFGAEPERAPSGGQAPAGDAPASDAPKAEAKAPAKSTTAAKSTATD